MAVARPLDVRGAGVGGLGRRVQADVVVFIIFHVAIHERDAGALAVPGRKGGGINLGLANV